MSGGRSQVHFVLCRLELARITTAKTSGKVICPKDTVENWSSITPTQCLPVSDIKNMYLRQPLQPSSNGTSYSPFISHQQAKLEKQWTHPQPRPFPAVTGR